MRNSNQIVSILSSFNLFLAQNGEEKGWIPQSRDDKEWVNECFTHTWEEVNEAQSFTRRNWWGSNGYYTYDGGFTSHKGEVKGGFESLGTLICKIPEGLSYLEASWYVKDQENWKRKIEIFEILKYQRLPFQELPKNWKKLFISLSNGQTVQLFQKLKGTWCQYTDDYLCNIELKFIEDFFILRQKPKGWEKHLLEFLTMELQFQEEGKYILFKRYREERWFWRLVEEVGFKLTLSLCNEALQVLIENEILEDFGQLKLPETYANAVEQVRKWTHRYEGWDPNDCEEIPSLGRTLQFEGLLVVEMTTTADALAVAHRYGNCLRKYVKKLLRKQLVVFEVINPQTGCTALLGYEPSEDGLWVTKEEFFRGVSDEEVTDPLILKGKEAFDLQVNQ
jgi:hypothetical protein